MASTAAGVAVGSTIGHALGGMFTGSSAPAEAQQQQPVYNQQYDNNAASQTSYGNPACEGDASSLRNCLKENQGNMQVCGYFLEQLKSCQSMSSQY